jgi:type IV secretory pathway VirJ component
MNRVRSVSLRLLDHAIGAACASALLCSPFPGLAQAGGAPVAPAAPPAATPTDARESFEFGRFGAVGIRRPAGDPREVVLFASAGGEWSAAEAAAVQRLNGRGAVVAVFDAGRYLARLDLSPDKCVSPAADFEGLSHYLQSKLGLKDYLQPALVGYSSGAALAYAALGEAPDGLFKGALSVAFCPELKLRKSVCKGSGIEATPHKDSKGLLEGTALRPVKRLPGRWVSLLDPAHSACPLQQAQDFAASVPGAEIMSVQSAAGESADASWAAAFDAAFARTMGGSPPMAPPLPAPVADLPLILLPATGTGANDWFAVFLSGDGGWAGIDQGVSAELAGHNIPVVGWDSLKYFWTARTPQGASRDLDRVLRHYSRELGRARALLIGYSQGADTLPFMVNRLPAATRQMVGMAALLGISDNALFEFHLSNWLGQSTGGLPTAPELAHWSGPPYLCLYGEEDRDAACRALTGRGGSALMMRGGHHFGGEYASVAAEILSRMPRPDR